MSNKAIARQLKISVYTVENHIAVAAKTVSMPCRARHALTLFVLGLTDDGAA
jgi:DNA-binding NarL/FixJ family response regulator